MGYSTEFLRGILALVALVAALALLIAGAAELLGLDPFGDERGGIGFGGFAVRAGAVLVVSLVLSAVVERWNG